MANRKTLEEITAEVEARSLHTEAYFPEDTSNPFYNALVDAQLTHLNRQQEVDNEQFVRDFYIHAKHSGRMSNPEFRGKTVYNINYRGIRNFFHLPLVETCSFQTRWEAIDQNQEEYPWEEVKHMLLVDDSDSDWYNLRGGYQRYLQRSSLCPVAKAWLHFICYNIMPTSHFTNVPTQLALLIYLLMRSEPVDVTTLIFDSLQRASVKGQKGHILIFPHFISQMYKKAGVPELSTDLEFDPEPPKDYTRLGFGRSRAVGNTEQQSLRQTRRVRRREEGEASTSQQPEPEANTITQKLDLVLQNQNVLL